MLPLDRIRSSYSCPENAWPGDPEEMAKGLQAQLKLTDKQTLKTAAIYKEAYERCSKIKKDEHGNTDKMVVSIRPLRAATVKKIERVLTPAQTVKFRALLKQTDLHNGIDWSGGVCYEREQSSAVVSGD